MTRIHVLKNNPVFADVMNRGKKSAFSQWDQVEEAAQRRLDEIDDESRDKSQYMNDVRNYLTGKSQNFLAAKNLVIQYLVNGLLLMEKNMDIIYAECAWDKNENDKQKELWQVAENYVNNHRLADLRRGEKADDMINRVFLDNSLPKKILKEYLRQYPIAPRKADAGELRPNDPRFEQESLHRNRNADLNVSGKETVSSIQKEKDPLLQ